MTTVGFAPRAIADVESMLEASREMHGPAAQRRYGRLFSLAVDKIVAEPFGPATVDRSDLREGIRSLHLRQVVASGKRRPVRRPVHVIFYRVPSEGGVWVLRVLHERMDVVAHL